MNKKTVTGKVVAVKMAKTVVVVIERKLRHPVYHKILVRHKRLKAHDEMGCKEGDTVKIVETRPLSKDIFFQVVEIVKK